jgi:serine/threonine-protein kinase RsbW
VIPENTVQLDLPARLEYLSVLSVVLGELLQKKVDRLADAGQIVYSVQLAIQEACTNIVRHAYEADSGGRILTTIALIDDPLRITVRLVDTGQWFDMDSVPEPDLDNPQVHGYGLFLIHQLMDEVSYQRDGESNVWRLVKYLPEEE